MLLLLWSEMQSVVSCCWSRAAEETGLSACSSGLGASHQQQKRVTAVASVSSRQVWHCSMKVLNVVKTAMSMPKLGASLKLKSKTQIKTSAEQKLSVWEKCISFRFCKERLLWNKSDLTVTFRIGWSSQRSFLICTYNEHIIYISNSCIWTMPCLFHYMMKYRCISRHTRKLFLNHLLLHCWLNKVIPGFQDLKQAPI